MTSPRPGPQRPELGFDGFRLRSWEPTDAETLVAAWADDDIARWNQVPRQPNLATAEGWIAGVEDRAAARLSFDWVIERATDAVVVGEVGLSGFDQRHRGALIGYWLLPAARGTGLAANAVECVTEWAHDVLGLDMIVARCHAENVASQRVAERAGYGHERTDTQGYQLWVSRS